MKNVAFILAFVLICASACTKQGARPCPDNSIKHKNACTTDCPGVKACNGKTYCNECEAARDGFWVEEK